MTYADMTNYLELLGMMHRNINSVVPGDYDDILDSETRKGLKYPAMWIETPRAVYGDSDATSQTWMGSIVILGNSDPKDKARTAYVKEQTFRIARQVLLKMCMNAENALVEMEMKNKSLDAIDTIGNDWDVGWRLSYTALTRVTEDCYDAEIWDEGVALDEVLEFEWWNESEDGNLAMDLGEPAAPEGWTLQWFKSIDGGTDVEIERKDMIKDACANVLVTVVATSPDGRYVRYASAYVESGVRQGGWSVPYVYTVFLNRKGK